MFMKNVNHRKFKIIFFYGNCNIADKFEKKSING